ncbi:MAG: hypothetical protein A2Y15_03405 [Clostridiales bacterium GWF2_36_10]|nr:MAG: hypothetical protein A2Y15_03405 [Clostridiales bacterium GWF2_36_10]HAN20780.1 ATP-binding protein [Clostridiales bacterium]
MKELSLNILDITMNSVKAGAKNISITLTETNKTLAIIIEDDGCGMTKEQLVRLSDPFFTTRTTRKVGLGIPFYRLAAEQTGGYVEVTSVSENDNPRNHGTVVTALFYTNSIDFTPLGDIISTVITLIQGSPNIDFYFSHTLINQHITLSTKEMRQTLGDDVPLDSYDVLDWIKEYLNEQYNFR